MHEASQTLTDAVKMNTFLDDYMKATVKKMEIMEEKPMIAHQTNVLQEHVSLLRKIQNKYTVLFFFFNFVFLFSS